MSRVAAAVSLLLVAVLTACSGASAPDPGTTSAPPGLTGVHAQLVFATVHGVELKLDACFPTERHDRPVVVIVPGGAFTERTTTLLRPECQIGASHGFATFVVDYRLVGEGGGSHYPDQVADVTRAVNWIRASAQRSRFAIDDTRMALVGESAGAVIASEIAVKSGGSTLPVSTFRAVALLSGIYDFSADDLSDYLLGIGRGYLGCSPSSACRAGRTASAIRYVQSDDPPMLLVNSTHELVPATQATRFAARLKAKGVTYRLILAPGVYHAMDIARHSASVRAALWSFCAHYTAS